MLSELRVENLLLIERAELRLTAGLNVLTGETGAGKTVLAHALDLLLGGRPKSGIVRPGADEAFVEGVFEVGEADVVLARRVTAEGRTRAYVGGRAASVGDLRAAAEGLLAFYGQPEHPKLTLASAQLDVLDAFAGAEQAERRAACAAAHAAAREAAGALEELRERAGARERELDLLAFELREIEALDPSEEDEHALLAERERLRHLEALRGAALAGAEAVGADAGVATLLASAEAPFDAAAGVDPDLDTLGGRRGGAAAWARAPGSIPTSTRWATGCGGCASRPRTSPPSCAATRTASRRRPAASRRLRSAWPPTPA